LVGVGVHKDVPKRTVILSSGLTICEQENSNGFGLKIPDFGNATIYLGVDGSPDLWPLIICMRNKLN